MSDGWVVSAMLTVGAVAVIDAGIFTCMTLVADHAFVGAAVAPCRAAVPAWAAVGVSPAAGVHTHGRVRKSPSLTKTKRTIAAFFVLETLVVIAEVETPIRQAATIDTIGTILVGQTLCVRTAWVAEPRRTTVVTHLRHSPVFIWLCDSASAAVHPCIRGWFRSNILTHLPLGIRGRVRPASGQK